MELELTRILHDLKKLAEAIRLVQEMGDKLYEDVRAVVGSEEQTYVKQYGSDSPFEPDGGLSGVDRETGGAGNA